MSSKTNFQKIREFHQTSNLDNHFEHQLDVFDNKRLIKLRIALIEEELNELKDSIVTYKPETITAGGVKSKIEDYIQGEEFVDFMKKWAKD